MKFSIIIPAYNAARTIERAINAALAIEWPDKEVIVVDDGSRDDTAAIAARYAPRVTLIRQPNGGPAKARNTGWRAATGNVCFFTDSDCLAHPGIIAMLAPHFADAAVGGAGGTYGIANPESLLSRLIHEEIVWRHSRMGGEVDFLGSFNCAYRRDLLEKTGGFNEEYKTASGEDNDLAYRIHAAGYKMIFDRRAAVDHFHETSLKTYLRRQWNHGVWRMKLYKEHRGKMKGDRYAGLLDLAQPPLALLLLFSVPLVFFSPACFLWLFLLAAYVLMQFPLPLAIASHTCRVEMILLAPLTFLRGFARGLGLLAGLSRFGL